jgi:GNAT superfamily N-acetyltransferase
MPRTFVLLRDDEPAGTASLAEQDLESRPDLSPWLAGVFVEPAARGQSLAGRLVAAVEDECRRMRIGSMSLYTRSAERVYSRARAGGRPRRSGVIPRSMR